MSGFEVLSALAAAAQFIEQGLKIIDLCSRFRNGPESVKEQSAHVKRLIEIAKQVEDNQTLQTPVVASNLRECLAKAMKLLTILSKTCAVSSDGKVVKWKKAFGAMAKEREILALLADLEREKNSLTLSISTINSKLLDTVKTSADIKFREQNQNDLRDRKRKLCIWLAPSDFEDEHKRRQRERVKGTNTWFLEQSSVKEWRDSVLSPHSPGLLWAYGKPGCGKSMLASSMVDQLQNLGFRPIYFFANSKVGNAIESSPLGLIRTLLAQLLDDDPQLLDSLFAEYTKSSNKEASSFHTLWEIFRLWCHRQSKSIFCVIDALDEAIDEYSDTDGFLESFVDAVNSCPMLRVCVTSRPNSRIERFFPSKTDLDHLSADGEDSFTHPTGNIAAPGRFCVSRVLISEDRVASDLKEYILIKVKQSRDLKAWLSQTDIDMLCARAEGMFLWARLMFDELKSATTPRSIEKKLSQAPKGLTNFYTMITARFSETLDEEHLLLCRSVLQWIITTKEPLTVNQLAVALATRDGQKSLNKLDMMLDPYKNILDVCAPLVEIVDDDVVRIIHLSVKDFLLDSSRMDDQSDFIFSTGSLNANAGIALLTLLSFDAFSATSFPSGSDDQIQGEDSSVDARPSSRFSDEADDQNDDENRGLQASEMLEYGLNYWHHHCVESKAVEDAHRLYELVCDYLASDKCFLWMDTLGRYRRRSDWIHTENQIVDWGQRLNVGNEISLSRGFVHRVAALRLEHLKKYLGSPHPETLEAMVVLARSWLGQGCWDEAEKLQVQVLETRKKVLGPEHQDTLKCRGDLVGTYLDQGRYSEVEELLIQTLQTEKRILGSEHPGTLASIARLATTYHYQGLWKEAEELNIQLTEIRKRVLEQEYPHTLWSMDNLAMTYYQQERWKEAEELQTQIIEIRKRVLGQEHPNTLWSMGNLAVTYSEQGRWKEAEELQTQVMEIRKRVLGQEHPHTLWSMSHLAHTWKALGRDKDAIALMKRAEKGRREALGAEHPDTLGSRYWLDAWETAFNFQEAGFSAETFHLGMDDEDFEIPEDDWQDGDSEVPEGDSQDEDFEVREGDSPDQGPISATERRPSSTSGHLEGFLHSLTESPLPLGMP